MNELNKKISINISRRNVVFNLILGVSKIFVGVFSNSMALISDGIHSSIDIIASIIVMIGIMFSSKKKTNVILMGMKSLNI